MSLCCAGVQEGSIKYAFAMVIDNTKAKAKDKNCVEACLIIIIQICALGVPFKVAGFVCYMSPLSRE